MSDTNKLTVGEVMDVLGIPYKDISDGVEYRLSRKDIASAFPTFDEDGALKALLAELKSEGWIVFWSGKTNEFMYLVVRAK